MSKCEMPDAARLAEVITDDFYNDRFDLSARRNVESGNPWSRMPEVEAVKQLRNARPETSARSVRLFLTFISALDRARDATQLWRAGAKLFELHPDLFEPTEVLAIPSDTLFELLSKNKVSQRHRLDRDAWRVIAENLAPGSSPVSRVIEDGVGNAEELLKELQSCDGTGRPRFPMLRGPKVGPMWVRIVANPGRAKIDKIDIIPVAVDVHIRRATENLGVTNTRGLTLEKAKPLIQAAWREAVSMTNIGGLMGISGTCAALDPAMWFFAKHGCSHCEKVGQQVPIGRACDHCQLPVRL